MTKPRAFWLVAIICLAVLGVRIGGVHLHLCFDGNEPPSAVHVLDGVHHSDGSDSSHEDEDVAGAADVGAKAEHSAGLLLIGLLATFAVLFLIPTIPICKKWHINRVTPNLTAFFFLHPPLRGPPAVSF